MRITHTHTHKKRAYSRIAGAKSQSAMEYLMTYGWAILIIAIVLGALFSLGVFSSANLSPRAQPGTCEVLRSTAVTSLAGQCSGLLPEYVAKFNGQSSYVSSNSANLNGGMSQLTLTAWINPNNLNGNMDIIHDEGAYVLDVPQGKGPEPHLQKEKCYRFGHWRCCRST